VDAALFPKLVSSGQTIRLAAKTNQNVEVSIRVLTCDRILLPACGSVFSSMLDITADLTLNRQVLQLHFAKVIIAMHGQAHKLSPIGKISYCYL
jgi:hypothetical protein